MDHRDRAGQLTRRGFVRTGLAAAAAAGIPARLKADQSQEEADQPAESKDLVPTRVLGRTGERVSMLNFGTAQRCEPRMLNAMYEAGIRYIDTADCYGRGAAEKSLATWFAEKGNRKEFFLVTKDHPETPEQWVEMLDRRLQALQTDYVDMFFIHMLGGDDNKAQRNWPRQKKWAQAADKMKDSGKVRFVGFSTHTEIQLRTALLNAAAAGGWVDAVMMSYDPQTVRENKPFNRALDKCHQAGVGLISMKEMRAVQHAPKFLPQFEEMGLTSHQAVLHAVWSDQRITSICSAMPNLKIVQENSAAAKNFKPLDDTKIGAVIDLYRQHAPVYCNACDGRCRRAAGTSAALGTIARCLSYYEMDGCPDQARGAFAALTPQQRNWGDADLAAASRACVRKLDFEALLARARQKLT